MSAFVVRDRTINRIVAYLGDRWTRDRRMGPDPLRPFAALGYFLCDGGEGVEADKYREEQRRRLAGDLFAMNCRAVDARYSDKPARTQFHPDDFQYREEMTPADLEACKRMSCLAYQCAEGDVPDEPLYRALREAQHLVAMNIVCRLDAYENLNCWE